MGGRVAKHSFEARVSSVLNVLDPQRDTATTAQRGRAESATRRPSHLVERRAPLELGALDDPPAWAPLAAPLAWLTAAELGATALWRLAVRSDGTW